VRRVLHLIREEQEQHLVEAVEQPVQQAPVDRQQVESGGGQETPMDVNPAIGVCCFVITDSNM